MAENLTQVLSNYTIYLDSSSLMHGHMEFFKISLYNVLKSTKRKVKIVDFVVKDLKKKQFSDNEKFAIKALKILDFYRKAGLVEDVVTSGIENGKILDVIYNNRNVDRSDVCVITENKDVANEIVNSLTARKGIDFDNKIAAVRLINGPALWNIQTVKPKVMPITREEPKHTSAVSFDSIKSVSFDTPSVDEVKIDKIPEIVESRDYRRPERETPSYEREPMSTPAYSRNIPNETKVVQPISKVEPIKEEFKPVDKSTRTKRNKLVVSIVVDNSTSLNDERSLMMKNALNGFNKLIQNSDIVSDLDLAIYGFDGFSPRVIKGYDGELDVGRFDNGGIQVLGKTIELAMDDLVERQKLYKQHSVDTHKPWLIILTDGGAYGDLTEQVTKLGKVIKSKKITYFPFCLSAMELDQSLEPLAKLKMFLKIRDNRFTDLFNFLYNTISQRIHTPDDVPMRLDRQALKGFIAR